VRTISNEERDVIHDIFKKLTEGELGIVTALIHQIKNKTGAYHEIKDFGPDLHSSSSFLANFSGIPKKESGALSKELWYLIKADVDRERQSKVGIKYGTWVYESYLCKYPSHAKLNNKKFQLTKGVRVGFFKRINTGQLVGCRCMVRPIIPGMDN